MPTTIRVLYVDDESYLLDLAKEFLEHSGDFTVTTSLSAPEAILILEKEQFDAIISDYQMLEMDGIEFLKHVRATDKSIPFIIFTGKGREEIAIEAFENGADFYIQKGGEPKSQFAELSHKIKKAVEGRRAEDALRESELFNRNLIENLPDYIGVIGPDGKILYMNPPAPNALGYTVEEMIDTSMLSYVAEEYRADVISRMTARREGREVPPYEIEVLSRDGRRFSVIIKGSSIQYRDTPAFLLVLTDITERKRAEEALRKNEERYKNISETITDFVFSCIKPAEGTYSIDWMAGAVERITGYTIDELIPKGCWKGLVHPDDTSIFDENFTNLPAGTSKACILRIRTKSGEVRWLAVNTTQVLTKNSSLYRRIFGGCRDITEHKRAEEALRESEELFKSVVYNSSDLTILTDAKGIVTFVSPQCESVLGYPGDKFIGQISPDIIYSDDVARCQQAWEQVIQHGQEIRDFECRIVDSQGAIRWISHSAKQVTVDGKVLGIQSDIRNITERKQIEDMIALTNRKLELMNDVTYQYIQNKVTGLRGYVELSKNAKTEAERISFIKKEEHILADIYQLIKNTKEYQEMGLNQFRWIPVEQSIRIAISLVSPKQGISIEINLYGLELFADPLIEKIFYKLIDNAEKHGKTITHLTFTCHETQEGLILTCEDDGVGISPEKKARLFERRLVRSQDSIYSLSGSVSHYTA